MMKMLGISDLRPGPSGDPKAPNAANSDESKATPCTYLSDPLIFNNGKTIKNANDWELRKKELFELFDSEMYGRLTANIPVVTWKVVSETDAIEGQQTVHIHPISSIQIPESSNENREFKTAW